MDIEDFIGLGFLFGGFDLLEDLVSVVLGLIALVVVVAIIAAAFLFLDPGLGMMVALVATGIGGVAAGGIAGAKLQQARYKYD